MRNSRCGGSTPVGESLVEYQLPEISISNHQNPSLLPSDDQDILIGKTRRIISRNGLSVMAKLAKAGHQPEVGALVEEEIHRLASERAPLGGCGETSSPFTRAWA